MFVSDIATSHNPIALGGCPEGAVPGRVPPRYPGAQCNPGFESGTLVSDLHAMVCFCSPPLAAALRFELAGVSGRDVRSLCPDLPFRRNTPGYNLAMAVFMAKEGLQPVQLVSADGGSLDAALCVYPVRYGGKRMLLAEVRWAERRVRRSDAGDGDGRSAAEPGATVPAGFVHGSSRLETHP